MFWVIVIGSESQRGVDVHAVAEDHHEQKANDEGAAFAHSIGEPCGDDGEDGGNDVDRYSH